MRALVAGFGVGLRRGFAERASLASNGAFFLIVMVAMAGLWRAAVAGHQGSLGGYQLSSLLWYVYGAQAAVAGARQRIIEEVGDEIGSGEIAVAMLRPVSVVGLRLSIEVGEAVAKLVVILVPGAALTWLLAGPPPSWGGLLLAAPAVAVGCVVNIAFQHALGGIAFWLKDAKSAWFLYQKLVFLPGGMLIPFELFPAPMAAVCRALPFAPMAYVPGRIASGHVDGGLLAIQLGWLVVLVAGAAGVFALGQRRLESVGG